MIKFKTLTLKNFLSVGAVTQTVDLNSADLNLVVGENLDLGGEDNKNGVGKSSILNALSYVIYDAALTRIKKDNLINKTNGKDMFVSLDFEKDGIEYRIERGRRKNVTRFWINGKETEQSQAQDEAQGENRDTQQTIENIIGMSHTMFKNIVGLSTYSEPFLSMRSNEQRDVIEQLLGITKLSEKAELLKQLLKQTKDSIKEEEYRLQSIRSSNETITKNINSLRRKNIEWTKKRDQEIESTYEAIQKLESLDIDQELNAHKLLAEYSEYVRNKQTIDNEIKSLKKNISLYERNIELNEERIHKSDNNVCHTCGSTIDDEKHQSIVSKIAETILDNQEKLQECQNKLTELEQAASLLTAPCESEPVTFYNDISKAYDHKSSIESLTRHIESIAAQEDPFKDQIQSLEKEGIQKVDDEMLKDLMMLKDHQEFLLKLLTNKDSFVRKKIIDQNLSYLNKRLEHYLVKLGLPHSVVFLSDMTVAISEHGRDLDFDNLSRGERTRLIIGLAFSFRDVFESLNHGINLLFIDELLDNGLDTNGVESSFSLLKSLSREQNKRIFLVSHREELVGRSNNIVKVIKEGGFTTIEQSE